MARLPFGRDEMIERLGAGLSDLYRTESLAVYAPQAEGWGVVFARGAAVPPGVDAAAPLLPALAMRARPLALDEAEGDALLLAPRGADDLRHFEGGGIPIDSGPGTTKIQGGSDDVPSDVS